MPAKVSTYFFCYISRFRERELRSTTEPTEYDDRKDTDVVSRFDVNPGSDR